MILFRRCLIEIVLNYVGETHFHSKGPNSPLTLQEYRNRQALLAKVKSFWIKGVLEKSCYNRMLMELGLEEQSNAVSYLWNVFLETESSLPRFLSKSNRFTEVFTEITTGKTLLISGESGAGKTTILLELTCDLVACAEQDTNWPIPVVLSLSSWEKKRQKIEDWLVGELLTKYNVPQATSKTWLKKQQILPLLDSLDEVEVDYRDDCVAALNQFKQDHESKLVICSCIKEWEKFPTRLEFQSAVYLKPLNLEQIYGYLDSFSTSLLGLKTLIEEDLALQKLAQSSLILNIMALTYQGFTVEELPKFSTLEDFYRQLFDNYIERRLNLHPPQYGKKQIKKWLILLAKKMMLQNSKQVFFIEFIQPWWLRFRWQKMLYQTGVKIIIGLILFATTKLSGLLVPDIEPLVLLTMNFIAILAVVCFNNRGNLISDLKGGLLTQFIFYTTGYIPVMLLLISLSALLTLTEKFSYTEIQPLATFKIKFRQVKRELTLALIGGTVVGLIVFLGRITLVGPIKGVGLGLISGSGGTLLFLLGFGFIGRLADSQTKMITTPNQGIRQSATNAIVGTLFLGLVGSLTMGLIFGPLWETFTPIETNRLEYPTNNIRMVFNGFTCT